MGSGKSPDTADPLHDEGHAGLGQRVVVHDRVVGHADERQHDRGHQPGPVLARRAVEHRRQVVLRREVPDDLGEGLGALGEAVDVVTPDVALHERGRKHASGGGVAVGQRRVHPLHVGLLERTTSGAIDLDRRPQVDHRAHAEPDQQLDVAGHKVVEHVGTGHHPRSGRATVAGREPAQVADIECPVERDEAVVVCRHVVTVRDRR